MKPGLYEQIINRQMNHELESIPEDCKHQEKVDSAEASRVLATYAAELLKRKMDAIYETSGDEALGAQISYINQVIGSMGVESEEQLLIRKYRGTASESSSATRRAEAAWKEGKGHSSSRDINGLQQLVYRCLTGTTDAYGIEEGDSVCRSD